MTNTLTKNDACCEAVEVHRTQGDTTYAPRFDIWEGEDELVLYGDLPGVAAEHLDVRFENRADRSRQGTAPLPGRRDALQRIRYR